MRMFQRQRQQHPLQFAAGEGSYPLVDQFLSVYPGKALCHRVLHGLAEAEKSGAAAHAAGEQVGHADRVAGVKSGTLGNVADAGLFASLSRLGKGDDALVLPLSQNGFQEGGFARAVGADDGGHFAAVDVKIHVLQNAVGSDFHGHILYPKAAGMAAGTAVM